MLMAIDPGPVKSAWIKMSGMGEIENFGIDLNPVVLDEVCNGLLDPVVIEMIASYGMPVGREVFETCVWIGRFSQRAEDNYCDVVYLPRKEVVTNICGSARAKDANVRAALIDRFGGQSAIKKSGVLYGISKDVWSALAIACTYLDTRKVAKGRK